MSKKTVKFLVQHLKRLKKSIPIPHFSVVVSGFRTFYDWVADNDPDVNEVLHLLSSLLLFLGSLFILGFIITICFLKGG